MVHRTGSAPARAVLPAVVLALCAACSSGTATDARPPATDAESDAELTATFTQLPIQVGTAEGLLRLTNDGTSDLPVKGVGLDWHGYGGEFLRGKDSVVPPGRTIDFPVALPKPDCAHDSGEIVAVVDTGDGEVRRPVERTGGHLVRRIHELTCARQYVEEQVRVEYGDSWRYVGVGRHLSLLGDVRLVRLSGDEPVDLLDVSGSPLYELELPGATRLPAGVQQASLPLLIATGGRCDEHSRSDVTAPFSFGLTLRVGHHRARLPLPPPGDVRRRAADLVNRACG